jgi:hypothetical protein
LAAAYLARECEGASDKYVINKINAPNMKLTKPILAWVCVLLIMIGIVYNWVIAPFSTPEFDFIAWTVIAAAFGIILLIGKN